jgi:cysteine/O-acetylserine efflux protein
MLATGWLAGNLLLRFPNLERYLGLFGAAYILWLAWHTLRASYGFEVEDQPALGFANGLLLQILNPKAIVYGLTVFGSLLAPIRGRPLPMLIAALGLAGITFSAITTWAVFGAAIRSHLRLRQLLNLALALLLVYSALTLSGLLGYE